MGAANAVEEVDVDGLEQSLTELVKAADATALVKGAKESAGGKNSLEYSGHEDERGKVGGGGASEADAGVLDDLMVGKMKETTMAALADAGYSADQIAGFMHSDEAEEEEEEHGKAEDDEDEEDGDEAEEDDEDEDEHGAKHGKAAGGKGGFFNHDRPEPHGKKKGAKHGKMAYAHGEGPPPAAMGKHKKAADERPMKKSLDELREDPDIGDAVDASEYVEALTARVADQLDGVKKSIRVSRREQGNVNARMAAALWQVGKLVKSLANDNRQLKERLGIVERTPAPAKGKTSLTGAQPLEKSLGGGSGGGEELKKSEILSVMQYMGIERKMSDIGGVKPMEAIGLFEGGNIIAPSTLKAVHGFLRQHPAEREKALAYT